MANTTGNVPLYGHAARLNDTVLSLSPQYCMGLRCALCAPLHFSFFGGGGTVQLSNWKTKLVFCAAFYSIWRTIHYLCLSIQTSPTSHWWGVKVIKSLCLSGKNKPSCDDALTPQIHFPWSAITVVPRENHFRNILYHILTAPTPIKNNCPYTSVRPYNNAVFTFCVVAFCAAFRFLADVYK